MTDAVPPSVSAITTEIKNKLTESPRPSPALIRNEAKRLQKRWNTISKMKNLAELPSPRRAVINGTGIFLHTNLGRAPLGDKVIDRITSIMKGYVNLELDLATGKRGGRTTYLDALFGTLVRHYEPVWVNNNAAAVLLGLNTLKKLTGFSRLVISRGELVEIGGGFRVPEIMEEAGFQLLEIGTTNKTRIVDYERILKKEKAVVCAVHPSNFVMHGFTENVKPADLINVCKTHNVPLIYDAGTMSSEQLRKLPKGFDMITLSTDKTLGGIQGGLIAAKPKIQKALLSNPFYRALRLDKISLTALEVAFEEHAEKSERQTLPLIQMMFRSQSEIKTKAFEISKNSFNTFILKVVDCQASVGGGSLPGETKPSHGLAIETRFKVNSQKVIQFLRQGCPAVLPSIVGGYATINMATLLPWEEPDLRDALSGLDKKLESFQNENTPN